MGRERRNGDLKGREGKGRNEPPNEKSGYGLAPRKKLHNVSDRKRGIVR